MEVLRKTVLLICFRFRKQSQEISFPTDIISKMNLYNQNKKAARYITEYVFWLFSTYLQSNSITENDDFIQ